MKRLVMTIAMVAFMVTGANAQYFENGRGESGPNAGGGLFGKGDVPESRSSGQQLPLLPMHGQAQDQAAPVGGGVMLLLGFGAAYAMCKRKEED